MNPVNYFDNAATTLIHPAVREAMLPWIGEFFGNPHSPHSWGDHARYVVENSRIRIAELLKIEDPSQITFTSGATEACNTLVRIVDPLKSEVSPFEHSAIRVPARKANIPVGMFSQSKQKIITACSNETGILYETYGEWYCDATQIVGKLPFDLTRTQAAAFSAHKFGGPMGVGVLYLKDPTILNESNAHQMGGGQEGGRRAGTLNVPGIIGLARALEVAIENSPALHALNLRNILKEELFEYQINESELQSPYILSVTIPGIVAQNLVLEVNHAGFAISSGAACSSQSPEPSPVLLAYGLTESEALSTIRISFSHMNTQDSAFELSKVIKSSISRIQNL